MTFPTIPAEFRRKICWDPFDDAPRLIAADWLDENGDEEFARFIRLQVARGNCPECGGASYQRFTNGDSICRRPGGGHCECVELMKEETYLVQTTHVLERVAPETFPVLGRMHEATTYDVCRGFLQNYRVPLVGCVAGLKDVMKDTPIIALGLRTTHRIQPSYGAPQTWTSRDGNAKLGYFVEWTEIQKETEKLMMSDDERHIHRLYGEERNDFDAFRNYYNFTAAGFQKILKSKVTMCYTWRALGRNDLAHYGDFVEVPDLSKQLINTWRNIYGYPDLNYNNTNIIQPTSPLQPVEA